MIPMWLSIAVVVIFLMSVAVLVFSIMNLVRAYKMNTTARWSMLRQQVYNNKMLEAQKKLERYAEETARKLKGLNE